MKRNIFKICVIFTFFSAVTCLNAQILNSQFIHNSCIDAKQICGKNQNGIKVQFPTIDSCNQVLEPQYFKMEFTGSGVFNLLAPGGFAGGTGVNQDHSGTYTLYGPFNSFDMQVCQMIDLGQVQEQTNNLLFNNQIAHQQGYYVLKVEVNECILNITNPNIQSWIISLGIDSQLLRCEDETNCEDCITSFSPDPGEYIVSGWVMGSENNKHTSYTNPFIDVSFLGGGSSHFTISPSGPIIDGWQKVEGVVSVPLNATDIIVSLDCQQGGCFFDDIRFVPIDGSMKSYVYDPISFKLVAELDERNYATFYEYDEEGKLIRVKKETEKGVMTIKENRNNIKKQ